MVRSSLLVVACFALALQSAPPMDPVLPKIEFDKKEGENPSSPKAGLMKAHGTYDLGNTGEYKYDGIELEYRLRGDGWTKVTKEIKVETKEKKETWELTVKDLPPGEYEVRVSLRVKNKDAQTQWWEVEKKRMVTIPAK